MNHQLAALSELLARRYESLEGPVAFVDESYRNREDSNWRFYLTSAIVVEANYLNEVRNAFHRAVPSGRWHSTEEFQAGNYRELQNFLRTIVEQRLEILISLSLHNSDFDLELSRRLTLLGLAEQLSQKGCRLVVYERRRIRADQNRDAALFSKAKAVGLIPRHMNFFAGHPAVEPLLWGADLTAWSAGRQLALGEFRWFKDFAEKSSLIGPIWPEASKKWKRPDSAAANESGPNQLDFPVGNGINRSSATIIAGRKEKTQKLLQRFGQPLSPITDTDLLLEIVQTHFPLSSKKP